MRGPDDVHGNDGRGRGGAGPRKDRPAGGSGTASSTGGVPDGLLLGGLGLLLGGTTVAWLATGIAGRLDRGSWPEGVTFTATPSAVRRLITDPQDLPAAWDRAEPSRLPDATTFWVTLVLLLLLLLLAAAVVAVAVSRHRALLAAARARRAAGPADPADQAGAPAPRVRTDTEGASHPSQARRPGEKPPEPSGRPTTAPHRPAVHPYDTESHPNPERTPGALLQASPNHAAADPVTLLTTAELTRSCCLFSPPRSDRSARILQPALLNATGAVLVTTADPDLWRQTVGNRSKHGPVHVFDPLHLLDTPARLRWAPHSGCEDPRAARSRARALLAPLRTPATDRHPEESAAHAAAHTLLRCWLHAAALDGRPFHHVHRWAAGKGLHEADRVLRTARRSAAGWSGEPASVLAGHPKLRSAALGLVRTALSPLSELHIRDACTPTSRSESFDLESFINERGTLYVMGATAENPRSHPGATPLLTALASNVVEHGRRMAALSSAGRLDPPMLCLLDDVAALAPLPELPELMAVGPSAGMPVLAVLRSEEQALHRWPTLDARAVTAAADLRLAYP
ncbi:type IV secretory system conjugative DNA transfer family protein [Streptomyces sp. HB2AG]|uniref:type IV secretory system conjugative DNA transfer family protein n=1 Tax=Streptomyces sp. HB2AG TaxID=2983400 RepID=UPI0022AAB2B5|nr:TraM recognition domain-containing protein [Streptomyces sp. HB2AG]MCZ2527905.1 TraM recognition domain-containing protein [Streptomyces sp. HB2AG]